MIRVHDVFDKPYASIFLYLQIWWSPLILVYYFRARELGIMDPLLELSIGISYIHRAVQRQADNRHLMILQVLTFMFNYYRLIFKKSENYFPRDAARMKQEVEYNIGRAFHQLGLLALAIGYYERALGFAEQAEGGGGGSAGNGGIDGDAGREGNGKDWQSGWRGTVTCETAHNLALVYAMSGNMGAARDITERYLVI